MASKKTDLENQSRFHCLLLNEDLEFLRLNYGKGSANEALGISGFIRAVVHQRVLGLKAKANNILDGLRDEDRPTGTGDKL